MPKTGEWISLTKFAEKHHVAISTVHYWIKTGKIPFKIVSNNGRKYYLINEEVPYPPKKTSDPVWLNNGLRSVPVVELPWHEDQINMESLIDESKTL